MRFEFLSPDVLSLCDLGYAHGHPMAENYNKFLRLLKRTASLAKGNPKVVLCITNSTQTKVHSYLKKAGFFEARSGDKRILSYSLLWDDFAKLEEEEEEEKRLPFEKRKGDIVFNPELGQLHPWGANSTIEVVETNVESKMCKIETSTWYPWHQLRIVTKAEDR